MRIFLALALSAAFATGALAQRRGDYDYPPTEATFRALLKAAEEPNRDVRARVAWALGRIGEEKGAGMLLELANDPTESVRVDAVRGLRYALPKGSRIEMAVDVETAGAPMRLAALQAAAVFGFEQRERLIQHAWERGSTSERSLAIRALSYGETPGKEDYLESALASGVAPLQVAAIEVLGQDGSDGAVERLLGHAQSDNFEVRAAVCRALAEVGGDRGLASLQRACDDRHFLVRREAIVALARIGNPETVGAIQGRIEEDDYTIRVAASDALGTIVTQSSTPHLAARVTDGIIEVRQAAEAALLKYPADMAYRDVMRYGGAEQRRDSRLRIWNVLGEYGHQDTADYAFEHLEDDDRQVRGYAMRIMRKLEDRRSIPHIRETLTRQNVEGASDVDVEECFYAAGLFGMDDFIGLARQLLRLILNPPEEFMPSNGMLIGSFRYLAEIGHTESVPLMEELFEMGAGDEEMEIMAEALYRLTGDIYELPPKPTPIGRYFIHVPD